MVNTERLLEKAMHTRDAVAGVRAAASVYLCAHAIDSSMDAERMRAFLLTLPHVAETMQWGNNLVFWVGDKAIGGKMFALMNLDDHGVGPTQILSYAAGPERYAELLEVEGLSPAPYLARAHWVAVEHWQVFRTKEWEDQLRNAYDVIFARLSRSTRAVLETPVAEQRRILKERRALVSREKPAGPRRSDPKKAEEPSGLKGSDGRRRLDVRPLSRGK